MISGDWSSPDPQRVDHGVHQTQDAARALEALEARPVLVEAIEQLGVDRVGLLDAVLVAAVARLAREVVGVAVVHLDEAAGGRADRGERVGVGRDEQPLADDVVRLVRRRGAPLVGDAAHDVLQALERLEAVRAADLLGVAGDRLGVVAALRRGDRDGEQHARRALDRLGERLRERELVVERPAREVVARDEAARVGDPLVDQDHRRGVGAEQLVKRLPGRGAVGVRGRDHRERRLAAELPRELAPDRVDLRPVGLHRARRRDVVADERDAPDAPGQLAEGRVGEHVLDVLRVVAERRAGSQVPQREHRVRLAAAEVRLQVDDRRGVLVARQAPHRPIDEVAQTLGEVGAREELDRLGVVLAGVLGRGDLVEVGGELSGLEVAGRDVIVGRKDLAPRAQPRGFGRDSRRLEHLAVVLVGGQATQPQADRLDLVGDRRRADRDEQPLRGVQAAVRVVVAEGLVVGPVVARLAQLLAVPLPDAPDRVVERVPARLRGCAGCSR